MTPIPVVMTVTAFIDVQWAVPINSALILATVILARVNKKDLEDRVKEAEDRARGAEVRSEVVRKIVDRRADLPDVPDIPTETDKR